MTVLRDTYTIRNAFVPVSSIKNPGRFKLQVDQKFKTYRNFQDSLFSVLDAAKKLRSSLDSYDKKRDLFDDDFASEIKPVYDLQSGAKVDHRIPLRIDDKKIYAAEIYKHPEIYKFFRVNIIDKKEIFKTDPKTGFTVLTNVHRAQFLYICQGVDNPEMFEVPLENLYEILDDDLKNRRPQTHTVSLSKVVPAILQFDNTTIPVTPLYTRTKDEKDYSPVAINEFKRLISVHNNKLKIEVTNLRSKVHKHRTIVNIYFHDATSDTEIDLAKWLLKKPHLLLMDGSKNSPACIKGAFVRQGLLAMNSNPQKDVMAWNKLLENMDESQFEQYVNDPQPDLKTEGYEIEDMDFQDSERYSEISYQEKVGNWITYENGAIPGVHKSTDSVVSIPKPPESFISSTVSTEVPCPSIATSVPRQRKDSVIKKETKFDTESSKPSENQLPPSQYQHSVEKEPPIEQTRSNFRNPDPVTLKITPTTTNEELVTENHQPLPSSQLYVQHQEIEIQMNIKKLEIELEMLKLKKLSAGHYSSAQQIQPIPTHQPDNSHARIDSRPNRGPESLPAPVLTPIIHNGLLPTPSQPNVSRSPPNKVHVQQIKPTYIKSVSPARENMKTQSPSNPSKTQQVEPKPSKQRNDLPSPEFSRSPSPMRQRSKDYYPESDQKFIRNWRRDLNPDKEYTRYGAIKHKNNSGKNNNYRNNNRNRRQHNKPFVNKHLPRNEVECDDEKFDGLSQVIKKWPLDGKASPERNRGQVSNKNFDRQDANPWARAKENFMIKNPIKPKRNESPVRNHFSRERSLSPTKPLIVNKQNHLQSTLFQKDMCLIYKNFLTIFKDLYYFTVQQLSSLIAVPGTLCIF